MHPAPNTDNRKGRTHFLTLVAVPAFYRGRLPAVTLPHVSPISASDVRNRVTPIPTPLPVRLIGSLGVAGSVAAMVSQLAPGAKVLIALACVVAALAVTLMHPYRKRLREYAEVRGVDRRPSVSMLLPLMVWWLLLMAAPLAGWKTSGAVATFVVLLGAAWVLFPHVDGSRRLAYAD